MFRRFNVVAAALILCGSASAGAADYRGMPAGWPAYSGSAATGYAPAAYGGAPAYYVARPVMAAPGAAVAYRPVVVAYRNPAYMAAYNGAPQATVAPAYYPSTTSAYYAPTPAYVTGNSYTVSPAGSSSAGSEASLAYAQPMAANYVPPRYAYRPTYAAMPVYAYRPVTAYQPIVAQPTTCYQPAYQPTTCYQPATTGCGTSACGSSSSRGRFAWLNPFNWFRRCGYRSCGTSSCGAAQPTTAYCTSGCSSSACGQPYYPTTPVVPVVPAPITTSPPIITSPLPGSTVIPPAGPRVPPPPTRSPSTFVPGTTIVPAETRPSLAPAPSGTPLPGGTFTPGGSFSPSPSPGSFPVGPSSPGVAPAPSFPSGSNYPPSDPYGGTSSTLTPAVGSGYRAGAAKPRSDASQDLTNAVIRAPQTNSSLPPGVHLVPDMDGGDNPRTLNRAPQLIDPRDKSALRADNRWAVVPAVWPKQTKSFASRASAQTRSESRAAAQPVSYQPSAADYDDRGWQSAR